MNLNLTIIVYLNVIDLHYLVHAIIVGMVFLLAFIEMYLITIPNFPVEQLFVTFNFNSCAFILCVIYEYLPPNSPIENYQTHLPTVNHIIQTHRKHIKFPVLRTNILLSATFTLSTLFNHKITLLI